jgi:hypothetical protein
MTQLSKNFTLEEFTFSPTAIKKGISNKPTALDVSNMEALCEHVLEPLREWLNEGSRKKVGIKISSGYRSRQLNEIIGGSKSSQHMTGQAVDFDLGEKCADVFQYIRENLEFDQMIWEFGNDNQPDWIHVSYAKNGNRKQCLRAYRLNGKTQYKQI